VRDKAVAQTLLLTLAIFLLRRVRRAKLSLAERSYARLYSYRVVAVPSDDATDEFATIEPLQ